MDRILNDNTLNHLHCTVFVHDITALVFLLSVSPKDLAVALAPSKHASFMSFSNPKTKDAAKVELLFSLFSKRLPQFILA